MPFTANDALKAASSLSADGREKPCPLALFLGLGLPASTSTDSTGALRGINPVSFASAVGSENVSPLAFLLGLGLLTCTDLLLETAAGFSDTLFLGRLRFGM